MFNNLKVTIKRNKTFWSSILILLILVLISACSKEAEIEKEFKEREKTLLNKIDKGIKLTSSELNALTGIYLWEQNNKGIEILERLKDNEVYRNERYIIYFNLSVFYAEKAKQIPISQERQQLKEKAINYLTFGFDSSPEKALAHYLRAKRYDIIGCIEKAKADLQEAINIARSMDIIYFENGIYLKRDKFIQIVEADLNRFKTLKDDCILARE